MVQSGIAAHQPVINRSSWGCAASRVIVMNEIFKPFFVFQVFSVCVWLTSKLTSSECCFQGLVGKPNCPFCVYASASNQHSGKAARYRRRQIAELHKSD